MPTRRMVLLATSAAAALMACAGPHRLEPRRKLVDSRDGTRPVIDVHCHIFNGGDLAIGGYVGAMITEKLGTSFWDVPTQGALAAAQQFYAAFSLGTPAELELLSFTRPGEPLHDAFYQQKRHDHSIGDFLDNAGHNLGWSRIRAPALEGPPRPPRVESGTEDGERTETRRFLGYVLKPRATLALILDENSRRCTNAAVLLTPALVDMTRWVDGSDTWMGASREWLNGQIFGRASDVIRGFTGVNNRSSTIREQMRVMRVLSERRPEGLLIHPFVPYDPWRGAVDIASGRSDEALREVREAVLVQGAMGIKLYPPMGFRASLNCDLDPREFRFDLRRAIGRVQPERSHPGYWLDRALEGLYAWCEKNDVPIMAHTGPSHAGNGREEYLKRANPCFWRAVIDKHPMLRVNLGHFGGIWRWKDEPAKPAIGDEWPELVYALLRDKPRQAFADMSDVPISIDPETGDPVGKKSDLLFDRIRRTFPDREVLRRGLMYGSDFPFTVLESASIRYRENFECSLRSTKGFAFDPAGVEDVMWRNAARFLGLTQSGKGERRSVAAERLAKFHYQAAADEGGRAGSEDEVKREVDALLKPFLVEADRPATVIAPAAGTPAGRCGAGCPSSDRKTDDTGCCQTTG